MRCIEADVEVKDSEMVGYVDDGIVHPAFGVIWICGDV